jgi:hypothetical protein
MAATVVLQLIERNESDGQFCKEIAEGSGSSPLQPACKEALLMFGPASKVYRVLLEKPTSLEPLRSFLLMKRIRLWR